MTATGTSEMDGGFSHERTGPLLGESNPVSNVLPQVSDLAPVSEWNGPETSLESSWEDSSERSCQVDLTPQGGKDLAEELSFNENPVMVVEPQGLSAMGQAAIARGYLWILLRTPGPQHRGRLGLYIEETIESLLEERGALPPGIHASTGLDASLSDQLYRARLVEMRGIALGIPSLEGITNLGRVLDAEDSAVLRWWMAATSDRPVRMVLSNENTKLRVYPSPVFFQSLFDVAPGSVTPLPPSPSMAESAVSMELSDLPPRVGIKSYESETNVFGTEVAAWDSLNPALAMGQSASPETLGAVDESVAPHGEHVETERETAPRLGWDAQDCDVSLPDLDRALGLIPALSSHEVVVSRVETTPRRSSSRVRLSTQLELEGLDSVPATGGPHVKAVLAELAAEATQASQEIVEVPTANFASLVPDSPAFTDEPLQDDTWSVADATDIDDLDTEEFLRTLEEDSSRAPEVAVEQQAPSILSPLPTKQITRSPFIRLADPTLAVKDDVVSADSREDIEASTDSREDVEANAEASAREFQGGAEVESSAPSTHEFDASENSEQSEKNEQADKNQQGAVAKPYSAATDPNDPFNLLATREWKAWVRNLEAARGPKPLSVIERMFVTDYTRLREAVRRGVADVTANSILDEWQSSFTTSYSEAFDALRVRGKRPTMVLDLPELAARLGRLQGARRVQLLMVDGLRFDLGLMVQERMRSTADASLTERLLLWSALPSVTSYQLELLGKGPDGLKEPGDVDEPPALVARGAAARSPRRVRTGSLELLKLDVVADALRQPGLPILERMDSIADDTASAIVDHLNKQAPRTMVVVFGDHGFAIDPCATGTTEEVKQGGASPEEILVPAFAWLTGAVH